MKRSFFLTLLMLTSSISFAQVEPIEVGTRKIFWSVQNGGKIKNISYQETVKQMTAGFAEIEKVCNVDFVQRNGGGNLRFEFHNNEGMATWWNGTKQYALGLAYPNGRIKFNNERPIRAEEPGNRNVIILTQHESFHVLMGWVHSTNSRCVIGTGNPTYFCRREVELLQQKYGKPTTIWDPVDRGLAGKAFWAYKADYDILQVEQTRLLKQRNESTDPVYRKAKQVEVLANHALIVAIIPKMNAKAKQWWDINAYWKGVPMVHWVDPGG